MNAIAEPTTSPVRIGAIAMDQRQRYTLRMLFSSKCNNRYQLVEESSAQICLLDLDSYGGEQLWQEFRQRQPRQPLILVSLREQAVADPHTLFVRKPIPVQSLIDAIERQCHRLSRVADVTTALSPEPEPALPEVRPSVARTPRSRTTAHRAASIMSAATEQTFVGMAPDIDPQDPAQTSRVYYNPEHYLQGHLQQALNLAVRHNRNVAIEGPWPTMELLIEEHKVRVAVEERHLRPHCTLPDATLELRLRQFDDGGQLDDAGQSYALPALFWKVALWASRGRLPMGTSLSQPIYLCRWPNFTRLEVTPYALAIAALWSEQPRSLIDTANHLRIPQRYVFAFYSAAKSLQLAGETRRAADTLIAPEAIAASHQRGLFGRLLNRLRAGAKA
ncbi:MAG: hypothetical protein P8103_02235 [Candidatus Thiodiazotropha sp.]